jgi:stage IV sporulation protein FB
MMTDPLTWSPINLGRWAGTQVRIHFFLILYVASTLLLAALSQDHPVLSTACWLGLLLLALAVHEFGHAAVAWWLGAEPEEVRLWPLGNMILPSSSSRSADHMLVALAGPFLSMVMVLLAAVSVNLLGAQFTWNPFGNLQGTGAPMLATVDTLRPVTNFTPAWWLGWFGYLNYVILLTNLLPALPFDGGRIFRTYLSQSSVAPAKDSMIPPLFARACALILVVVGVIRLVSQKGDGVTVLGLALLIELMVRTEARMIEDGGFFDDGVFGYDFSEGYTSLEGSAAKVRPYRESAIRRWRRRRSDLRRQRRQEKEAAEERRMDEILEKLHREGRTALSDEEHRFLVRVSVKYRNKPRAQD